MLAAFVFVHAEPRAVGTLAQDLAEIPGVDEVYSVSGDADIVAIVRVRHHDDLAEVVTGRIARLDGIRSTRTMVAFQAYRRRDVEATWSLGAEGE